MPWAPELFAAPELQRWRDRRRRTALAAVPYFDGLLAGEPAALVESFAGPPHLHHPRRGRVKGEHALQAYVGETVAWLRDRDVRVEDVARTAVAGRGCEEVVLHLDGDGGRVELPVAIVTDRAADGRIDEIRLYYSRWPLTGRHETRPPVLQPGAEALRVPAGVRALAEGDTAAFAPDGYVRETEGVHGGADAVRKFYARGFELEACALLDDGRLCALEYNLVRWGETELPPQAGVATYVRDEDGRLAAARLYDDVDRP